jgi:hypothetical protein
MSNKRIFYASQSVHLQPVSTGTEGNYRKPTNFIQYGDGKWILPRGLQSAGISTTFNSTPVSQLGTLQIYSQTESVPQVEVTLNKVLDGTAPLYSLCTAGIDSSDHTKLVAYNKNLTEITNNMVNVRFAVFPDTISNATGLAESYTLCSGMYLSRVSYSFPVEGTASEEVTLVGSSKVWGTGTMITVPSTPVNITTDDDATPQGSGTDYVVRRQFIALTGDVGSGVVYPTRSNNGKITALGCLVTHSILPTGKGGIPSNTGEINPKLKVPMIQNITISANLGRENINELGYFGPYYKYTTFPIEVTSEFQVISTSGDLVDADDFDTFSGCSATDYRNLTDKEIAIRICGATTSDSMIIDLGTKNKLTSVNYTGGDTGGGNATTTYSFQTFNKLNILPTGDYMKYKNFTDGSSPNDTAVSSLT